MLFIVVLVVAYVSMCILKKIAVSQWNKSVNKYCLYT